MELIRDINLINNFILIAFFVGFAVLFFKEHRSDSSPLVWTDLLIDEKTNRLSLTKLSQFWGIAISSWIILNFAQRMPTEKIVEIFATVFGIWAAYLVGSYGWSTFMKTKTPVQEPADTAPAKKIEDEDK